MIVEPGLKIAPPAWERTEPLALEGSRPPSGAGGIPAGRRQGTASEGASAMKAARQVGPASPWGAIGGQGAPLAAGAALGVLLVAALQGSIPLALLGAALLLASVPMLLGSKRPAQASAEEASLPIPDQPGLEAVIDAASVPLVLLDPALQVSLFNRAALDLLPNLADGGAIVDAIRVPAVIEAVRAVAAGGAPQRAAYQERVPVERAVEVSVAPIRDRGSVRAILMSLDDVSQARQIEAMRVDFVANASHELRTPLASLSGFIETLQGPARNDPQARERFLAIMRAQADRMSRLIDDLLSLSRIELNAHVQPRGTVDLAAIVGHVADTLAPLAGDAGVAIELQGFARPLVAFGDRDELIRVFENLIENAIKYGGAGSRGSGRVQVAAERVKPDEIAVTVRDFGAGIAAEHLPRLTERFYRVDVGQSRQRGGTGLGLAIVKHIVARHRGKLVIQSWPGEGSAFTVRLQGEGTLDQTSEDSRETLS